MARYKKGVSGNPNGRPRGSRNQNQFRQRVEEVLDGRITTESLNKDLDQMDPRERINAILRLLEFVVPRLKGIEIPEPKEEEKSRIDLGLLTREERQGWYKLYDKACGISNGQAVTHENTKDHG